MGPPGAGKGTQSKKISQDFGIPEISTGALFRTHVANQTELGAIVSAIMEKGELVPDAVTVAMLDDRLTQPDTAPGFLLDGFPRTVAQADALDQILATLDVDLDVVLSFNVDQETLIQRMLKRAAIEGRSDDNEETIRRRFEVYTAQTEPLLALYRDRGILVEIDGMGTVDEVHARIMEALKK